MTEDMTRHQDWVLRYKHEKISEKASEVSRLATATDEQAIEELAYTDRADLPEKLASLGYIRRPAEERIIEKIIAELQLRDEHMAAWCVWTGRETTYETPGAIITYRIGKHGQLEKVFREKPDDDLHFGLSGPGYLYGRSA